MGLISVEQGFKIKYNYRFYSGSGSTEWAEYISGFMQNIIKNKINAPGEDRTHDLQISQIICDYETDALPTALPRLLILLTFEAVSTMRCRLEPLLDHMDRGHYSPAGLF